MEERKTSVAVIHRKVLSSFRRLYILARMSVCWRVAYDVTGFVFLFLVRAFLSRLFCFVFVLFVCFCGIPSLSCLLSWLTDTRENQSRIIRTDTYAPISFGFFHSTSALLSLLTDKHKKTYIHIYALYYLPLFSFPDSPLLSFSRGGRTYCISPIPNLRLLYMHMHIHHVP